MPAEFLLFGLTLLAVAVFHRHALVIAASGLLLIVLFEALQTHFPGGEGWPALGAHLVREWALLANLLLLLTGFSLVARHFELSGIPLWLPRLLPDDWTGALALLVIVFVISAFLDNIAAALIGGAMAHTLFRGRMRVGYLAAIVAASNAGGSGSVIGDTTTTMMWIAGVPPAELLRAYGAALVAMLVMGIPAAIQQQRFAPIIKDSPLDARIDWGRVAVVALVLGCAILVNVVVNTGHPQLGARFPFIGAAVAGMLLATSGWRRPDWSVLPAAFRGSLFLLCLVASASLMPVEQLPPASWKSALTLGFVSAVFDNIPLTALALAQGGYDWGLLAYAIGFGGSMIWFGSSAGVAMTGLFPEARSTGRWLRDGWLLPASYLAGFFCLLALTGWRPGQ
jgi:Na+/H+ antiporter NhaD/arsenite permease-like protein